MAKEGLEPLIDSKTRVLILGSLPSDASISAEQYYANPTNDFWRIMEKILRKPFVGMDYSGRKQALLQAGVGLWDVFHSAERSGSMDDKITGAVLNDFSRLKMECHALRAVYFNGQKAGEHIQLLWDLGYDAHVLPSTSAANRSNQIGRLNEWKKIRKYLL